MLYLGHGHGHRHGNDARKNNPREPPMTHVRPLLASAVALCVLFLSAPGTLADASPQRRLELAIEQKDAAAAKAALKDLAAKDDEPSARAVLELCGKGAAALDLEEAAADALASMASDAARKALFKEIGRAHV